MNKLTVVCLLVACAVVCQARIPPYPYPKTGSIRNCRDYMGRLIRPGQSYNDGCNTCMCGINGRPTICTLRHCDLLDHGNMGLLRHHLVEIGDIDRGNMGRPIGGIGGIGDIDQGNMGRPIGSVGGIGDIVNPTGY